MKLEVGKAIYLKAMGNNARYKVDEYIEEWTIKKIGRKYFDVWKDNNERRIIQFHIEDNKEKSDYASWQLFFSLQEIENEKESAALIYELRKIFGSYGKIDLSLDQLRKIKDIITLK
jgi:hypothetical protein